MAYFCGSNPPSTVPSNRIEEGNGITVRSALLKISLFGKGFTNEKVTSRLFGGYGIDPASGARNEPLDYLFRRRIYNTRRFHRARVEMDGIFDAALDTTSLQLWGR
jgi:hypothetical protein